MKVNIMIGSGYRRFEADERITVQTPFTYDGSRGSIEWITFDISTKTLQMRVADNIVPERKDDTIWLKVAGS